MFARSRVASTALFFVLLFGGSAAARTPHTVFARVRLSVFNDAAVPSDTLAIAAARATFVFAQSGIELDWIDCGHPDPADFSPPATPCSALAWPRQLSVRILARGRSIHADIFGQAFLDESGSGVYANVYYNNLSAHRVHAQPCSGEMLGLVIAHEVGHLLLGTNSHSSSGLMQPIWYASALQTDFRHQLLFTAAESDILRARLAVPPPLYASSRRDLTM